MIKSLKEVEADFIENRTQQEEQKQQSKVRALMIANIALGLSLAFLLAWYFLLP
jgi:hypothetical protein